MFSWNRRFVFVSAVLMAFNANANEVEDTAESQPQVQDAFMQAFKPFCGQAYSARIVEDNAPSPAWDYPLVVHIRDCEDSVIRMPLHVGDDRSRTWVLTLYPDYIDFQHYHLHEDGSPDAVSPYGGQTQSVGTANQQSFPVDEASKALFLAEGLDVSVTNTWTIDFPDQQTMRYRLSRPGRLFEVEVDLSKSIPLPPPAWGYIPPDSASADPIYKPKGTQYLEIPVPAGLTSDQVKHSIVKAGLSRKWTILDASEELVVLRLIHSGLHSTLYLEYDDENIVVFSNTWYQTYNGEQKSRIPKRWIRNLEKDIGVFLNEFAHMN